MWPFVSRGLINKVGLAPPSNQSPSKVKREHHWAGEWMGRNSYIFYFVQSLHNLIKGGFLFGFFVCVTFCNTVSSAAIQIPLRHWPWQSDALILG